MFVLLSYKWENKYENIFMHISGLTKSGYKIKGIQLNKQNKGNEINGIIEKCFITKKYNTFLCDYGEVCCL